MSYEAPVSSDVAATGISSKQRISWRTRCSALVSRRSAACLVYRWRFARLSAPRHILPFYILADTGRVLAGAFRDWAMGRDR